MRIIKHNCLIFEGILKPWKPHQSGRSSLEVCKVCFVVGVLYLLNFLRAIRVRMRNWLPKNSHTKIQAHTWLSKPLFCFRLSLQCLENSWLQHESWMSKSWTTTRNPLKGEGKHFSRLDTLLGASMLTGGRVIYIPLSEVQKGWDIRIFCTMACTMAPNLQPLIFQFPATD